MDNLGYRAEAIRDMLEPLATMIVAKINPSKDEISHAEAYRLYTRRWVDEQERRGNLEIRYKGSRAILSRQQIEVLIAAEKESPRILCK